MPALHLGVLALQQEAPFSTVLPAAACCRRPTQWPRRGDAGSSTRCFAAPNLQTMDLAKPILTVCVLSYCPSPRLSLRTWLLRATTRPLPVCRVTCLSVCRQQAESVGREDLPASHHRCCDATTLKDRRAATCGASPRSSDLRARGALLSNHTASRRVGSTGQHIPGWLPCMLTAVAPARLRSVSDIGSLELHVCSRHCVLSSAFLHCSSCKCTRVAFDAHIVPSPPWNRVNLYR